ncbi:hypothetical protein DL98DRAFT_600783 [Cadophora sp. DSE1049]|nr:hypothetical protein DL98DRAFT_600783 [Cadophora sp. DSE1049]
MRHLNISYSINQIPNLTSASEGYANFAYFLAFESDCLINGPCHWLHGRFGMAIVAADYAALFVPLCVVINRF